MGIGKPSIGVTVYSTKGILRLTPIASGRSKRNSFFYVFHPIVTDVEDGIDSWCVGDKMPNMVMHGMERKDHSYLVGMQSIDDCPEYLRDINDKFSKVLAQFDYRGPFSNEVRDETMIDPTLRYGSPPSQIQTELITNLADVAWYGANGECLEPEFEHDVGGQVLVTTKKPVDDHITVDIPSELKDHYKAAFSYEVDGVLRIAPNPLDNWAGWIVATGDTVKEVVDTLKERKEMLPDGFQCDITSMSELLKNLESANEEGIDVVGDVPDPSVVL